MEWELALLIILGSLLVLMVLGLPVAFCFMFVNVLGAILFWGGEPSVGLRQLIVSLYDSVTSFILLPLPLFVLMGEVIFYSGVGPLMMDALDKLLGRLPGRLGLMAVGAGTMFATLTGTSLASVAMLGAVLVPEMEKRGYKKPMSLGPILGSSGLAMMIPPSALAVLLAAVGRISVGKVLIAIIIPGLLMAVFYASYIIGRCMLQPSIAPSYELPHTPLLDKLVSTVRYILPMTVIVFLVIGLIFLGIATPSEAAATGAIGCFLLAAAYRRLNWEVVKKAVSGTLRITVMIFMIIAGATAFGQNLAYTGASRGIIELATSLPVAPIVIMACMQAIVVLMGTFMDVGSIIMVTVPLFIPIVRALGFNEVWFATIMLLGIETGVTSPPFGMNLFVMKSVAPPDTTMGDCYRAALPFIYCDLIVMVLMIAFPAIALWLPGLMF